MSRSDIREKHLENSSGHACLRAAFVGQGVQRNRKAILPVRAGGTISRSDPRRYHRLRSRVLFEVAQSLTPDGSRAELDGAKRTNLNGGVDVNQCQPTPERDDGLPLPQYQWGDVIELKIALMVMLIGLLLLSIYFAMLPVHAL